MKKGLIIFSLLSLFLGMNIAQAETYCTLQDEAKWKYEISVIGSEAQEFIDAKTYDHYKCCTHPSGMRTCDFYSAVEIKNDNATNNSGNASSNQTVDYCGGLKSTFMFIGHIVNLAKILIPIVIIGFGMYDFFKAVTGSKDDEIKKSAKSLIMRCIAGVCVFFLPAVISLVFSWIEGWSSQYEQKTNECFKCIWDVNSCK